MRYEDLDALFNRLLEENFSLAKRLASMTEERDALQLRLHAVDHAYNEQQKSVQWERPVLNSYKSEVRSLRGLLVGRDKTIGSQRELIARQRQFIRTLYTSRAKKKAKADVKIGIDLGKPGGDESRLAWKCSCGNCGLFKISEGEGKQWNCVKCGRSYKWKA